jgi:steroid delta-isomerase-like uncharacterized protein
MRDERQCKDLMAMSSLNTSVVRRLMEDVWGRGQLQLLPTLVSEDYVGHLQIGDHYGPEGVRIDVAAYRTAFPDLTVTIDDLFAIGDRVVRRYTLRGTHLHAFLGAPGHGQTVVLHVVAIDRLVGGQLVESWVHGDSYPPIKS